MSLLDDFLSKNEILKKQLIPATRQIFELDSSSPQKFSRHLLIRFPGTAFKHNGHVGALVKHFADHVWTCASNDPRAAQLVVCKGQDQGHTLLIDTGVYSRNRAFRLFLSSKAGKEAILRSTGRYETAGLASEQLFMATLVGNVFPEALLVHYNLDGGETNSCPNPSRLSPPGAKSCSRRLNGKDLRPIQSTSPYPALDDFIKVASGGGIRSWMAIDDGVILYNIKDNRYCGNIGRQHRSNGVFYVVDLHHKVWYQKCHDPDCKTYRSPLSPLPPCLCDMVDNLPTFLGDCNGGGGDLGLESDDKEWEEAALQALIAVEQSAPLSPQLTADGLAA